MESRREKRSIVIKFVAEEEEEVCRGRLRAREEGQRKLMPIPP